MPFQAFSIRLAATHMMHEPLQADRILERAREYKIATGPLANLGVGLGSIDADSNELQRSARSRNTAPSAQVQKLYAQAIIALRALDSVLANRSSSISSGMARTA